MKGDAKVLKYLTYGHKEDRLYAEIQPQQFDKPLLCPIAIARGMAMGGYTLNFDEQWVLMFRRVGDKIHLIRRNVHFQARKGSPVAKAVETTYTDSVLMALPLQLLYEVSVWIAWYWERKERKLAAQEVPA